MADARSIAPLLGAAVWLFLVASVSAWAAIRHARALRTRVGARHRRAPSPALRVSVVRPCAGSQPHLRECLESFSRAICSHHVAIVIAIESPADPAAPQAREACQTLTENGIDAQVVFTKAIGPNMKVDQIGIALAMRRDWGSADVLLLADSDVDLTGTDLDALIAPLEGGAGRAGIAASWAPPVEVEPAKRWGDRVSQAVLGASLHAFPLLAQLDPAGMVGKLVALRMASIEAAGGLEPLVHFLGEDMELARRLRSRGDVVRVSNVLARSRQCGRTLGESAARYARWIAVIRAQRPILLVSYPLLIAATPLIFALIALGALAGPHLEKPLVYRLAAGLAVATLGVRGAIALAARSATGGACSRWGAIALAPFADLLLLQAFASATLTREVRWRGVTLRFDRTRAGMLLPRSTDERAR